MTSDEILLDCEERLEKAVNVVRDQMRGLRTGRSNPAMLDNVRVEYYGSPTPIKQLAQISAPDPSQQVIRLSIPAMSGEQRTKLVKRVKELAEDAKIACRNVRRDANTAFDTAEKD